jgi:hypothetical protein
MVKGVNYSGKNIYTTGLSQRRRRRGEYEVL